MILHSFLYIKEKCAFLIVNAGSINDGSIEVRPTAALILRNAGTIHLKKRGDLKVYIGGHAYLVNGNVLPYE